MGCDHLPRAAEARASLPRKWLLGFDSPRSEAEEALGEIESIEPHAVHPEEETLGEARAATTSGGVVTAAHGLGRCRPRIKAARNCWRPSIPAVPGRQTRPHDEAWIQLDDGVDPECPL